MNRPLVSVVVPMLNETGFIERCLDGFAAQTYGDDNIEVLVVDGGSTDGSREIVERLAVDRPWIRVIENPDQRASAAFNRGVEASKGDVICLFSAHGVPDPDYIEASVEALGRTGAAGVGGVYRHVGLDRQSSAIGLAMVSPFGMASPHRFGTRAREVDTISHPAYDAAALRDVGPFDETLLRNSDYELNWRLRARGHRLVFDPAVSSIYRPRGSISGLARQFWWYGRWKKRVISRHRQSLRARHLAPPGAVAFLGVTPLLALRPRGRRLVRRVLSLYFAMVAAAVVHARPADHDADPFVLALCFPVMHLSWGAGFIASVVEDLEGARV